MVNQSFKNCYSFKLSRYCSFDEILLETIMDSLDSLGGECKKAILFQVESTFEIKKEEIPQKISLFCDVLERIFGLGYKPLEKLFKKYLHIKICKVFEMENQMSYYKLSFLEYVDLVRGHLENYFKSRYNEVE